MYPLRRQEKKLYLHFVVDKKNILFVDFFFEGNHKKKNFMCILAFKRFEIKDTF